MLEIQAILFRAMLLWDKDYRQLIDFNYLHSFKNSKFYQNVSLEMIVLNAKTAN